MACSKIFSGELPELSDEIIQYFRNDFSTLHSCILVNRLWCRLAIPILWENPFSIISRDNYYCLEDHKIRFIDIYLHNLNDEEKIKLNEYGINFSFLSNTLFNYPNFIKHLKINEFIYAVEEWIKATVKIEVIQNSDSVRFIYKSLLKIFTENEANLYTLEINNHYNHSYDAVSELISQNLNLLLNSNCSNTLETITFHCIDF